MINNKKRGENYFNRPFKRLLYVKSLAHYSRVQLALERQQVHVGLRLGYEFPNLLWYYFVSQLALLFAS